MRRWGGLILAGLMLVSACGDSDEGIATGGQPTATSTAMSTSRPPFNGRTVEAGEVQKVSELGGAKMQPLKDAEIRGHRTSVKVLEFGTADQIDADGGYRAADGAVLIAFRVSAQIAKGDKDVQGEVVANVSVDGTQRSLKDLIDSTPEGGSAKTYSYVVAVPENRRSVDLELKSSSTVQSFDLLEGRPKGDRPAALYRPRQGTVLVQQALTPATFEIAPRNNQYDSSQSVTVSEMDFSYFNPETGAAPSGPDKAWLLLYGKGKTTSPGYYTCVPVAAAHKLVDDKGTTYELAAASEMPAEPALVGEASFKAAFEVPADLAKATFTIAPTQAVCQLSTATYTPVPARGEAKIAVSVPAS
jgi:hypothetical protein